MARPASPPYTLGKVAYRAHPTKAGQVQAGSADLCLLTEDDLDAWSRHLSDSGVAVILGPVARTGARGGIMSLYIRDPDANLIEISRYA